MIESQIKQVLRNSGWKEDRYGNFLSISKKVRVHFQKISLRVEKKIVYAESFPGYTPPPEWRAITSGYYKDVVTENNLLKVGTVTLKAQV